MTTPITDDQIDKLYRDMEAALVGAISGGEWLGKLPYAVPRLLERVRSDAATIADLRRQVEERDARINRLRATAEMGDLVTRSYGCLGGQCIGHGCAVCMMRDALSTLAPGDLGGEG